MVVRCPSGATAVDHDHSAGRHRGDRILGLLFERVDVINRLLRLIQGDCRLLYTTLEGGCGAL